MTGNPTTNGSRWRIGRIILGLLGILYFAAIFTVIGYIWFFAQDRFVTSATIKISRQGASSVDSSLLSIALPGLSESGSGDTMMAIGLVDSSDMLLELEKEFDLVAHYSSPARDFFFRLKPDAPVEERIDYYRDRIKTHFDKETGLVIFTVDAYDPEFAHRVAMSVLEKTEVAINELNQKVAEQQLAFSRREVERTSADVEALNQQLLELQNQHNFVNPDEMITASLLGVQELKLEYLRAEADLSALERDSPGSPRIETLRSRITSLQELIDIESAKLSGPEKDRLNQILVDFKGLQQKIEFAIQLRTGALLMLEKNRINAISQSRFFSIIQNPYVPEKVGKPNRVYDSLTILVLGLLLFAALRSLIQSVLDRG